MDLLTKTLDIDEEIGTHRSQIDDVEREMQELAERSERYDPPETEEDEEKLEEIETQFRRLENRKTTLEGRVEALERAKNEWSGTEITVREISASETRIIIDEATRKARERGLDSGTNSIHETEFMQRAIERTPGGCPNPDNIGDLPERLFDWLLDRANTLNSTGEFNMGNSSTRDRMRKMRSNQET